MPVADHQTYRKMLENAFENKFAYPAINVTSEITANAALKAFADLKSDGILQVSTGGGKFASGQVNEDMVMGAVSIAEHIHRAAGEAAGQRRDPHRPLPAEECRRFFDPVDRGQ